MPELLQDMVQKAILSPPSFVGRLIGAHGAHSEQTIRDPGKLRRLWRCVKYDRCFGQVRSETAALRHGRRDIGRSRFETVSIWKKKIETPPLKMSRCLHDGPTQCLKSHRPSRPGFLAGFTDESQAELIQTRKQTAESLSTPLSFS